MRHSPAAPRRARSHAYLLAKYEQLGTVHAAFWELTRMHDDEPGRYRTLTGSDRLPRYETFHKHWKEIPVARRREAKQRYLHRCSTPQGD